MIENINLFKIFHAVAKSKSFTKASEKLQMEKSTISRNVNQLEDFLGVQLFYRDNKGVKLTTNGEKLFDCIDKAIGWLSTGEKLVQEKNDMTTGELIIGALSHISDFYLMECIEKVKKDYPKLKVKLITGATGKNLIELLENHKIDFAIDSTTLDIANKDIVKEELKEIDNIFISKEPIVIRDLKQLSDYKFILGLEYTTTTQQLINLLKKKGVYIKPDIEIDITELKIKATQRGLGIGYVMRDSVKEQIERHEIYEVKMPLQLPSSKINLLYIKGQLTNIDKKFIKEYLKK